MTSATDTANRISHLLCIGTIVSVDPANATCRVQAGELLTTDIPWLAFAAGPLIGWSVPQPNETVLLACPEGDTERAIAIRGLYSSQFPPPQHTMDTHCLRMPDGTEINYNTATHTLNASVVANGTVHLKAAGGITIDGPFTVNGDTLINGNATIQHTLTASDDVVAASISLKNHTHPGVQSGGSKTGTPL